MAPPLSVARSVGVIATLLLLFAQASEAQLRKQQEAIDANRIAIDNLNTQNATTAQEIEKLEASVERNRKGLESSNGVATAALEKIEANAAALEKANQQLESLSTHSATQQDSLAQLAKQLQPAEPKADASAAPEKVNQALINRLEKLESFQKEQEQRLGGMVESAEQVSGDMLLTQNNLNRFWVLISALLVFFMQAGFKALEAGVVRKVHADSVAIKNLLDWLIVCVVFYFLGYGLMFGASIDGWIGNSLFFPNGEKLAAASQDSSHGLGFEFFLFQLAFAGTAATIVSGAISERTILPSYLILTCLTTIAYSILGHWSWASLFVEDQSGILENLGFHDFAGSTVVHSLGAWIALAAVIVISPRTGRFKDNGDVDYVRFKPNNLAYSALGVFILWFGWFGFNGGSVLAFNQDVSSIIFNTTICAAIAGISAFTHAWLTVGSRQNVYPKLIGGILGGLVAITACCDVVTPLQAILLGLIAGIVHNLAFDLMLRMQWDDVVGAVPVHGACGVLGTLWVAVGGETRAECLQQLQIQALGVVTVFVLTFFPFLIICALLHQVIGLRIGMYQEQTGYVVGSRRDQSPVMES